MASKVHDIVMEKILAALDAGVAPWVKPWQTLKPFNAKSKHKYTGVNAMLLGMSGRGPGFMTAKQIKELGGKFAGVKSELVTFYSVIDKKKDGQKSDDKFFMLRYYLVFPVSEVTELPQKYYDANSVTVQEHDPVVEAEAIIAQFIERTGVKMFFGGDSAFYRPSTDEIHIPPRNTFASISEYYCTVFHEMMHSTQHKDRCNIKDDYAPNELRAEIGASVLLGHVGLDMSDTIQNAASYCSSWAGRIRGEKSSLIVSAASKAYSGVSFVLGDVAKEEEVSEAA